MTDTEKIIDGLTKARNYLDVQQRTYESVFHACDKPGIKVNAFDESIAAIDEAIERLKDQKTHIVTDSDFDDSDSNGFISVWAERKKQDGTIEELGYMALHKNAFHNKPITTRFWTSKPTEEQRKVAKWESSLWQDVFTD